VGELFEGGPLLLALGIDRDVEGVFGGEAGGCGDERGALFGLFCLSSATCSVVAIAAVSFDPCSEALEALPDAVRDGREEPGKHDDSAVERPEEPFEGEIEHGDSW